MTTIRDRATGELDADTLYRILALRSAVFVVEQECVYLDPDGRDLEPGARQVWAERDGGIVAGLRLLPESGPDGQTAWRVGRVVTAEAARGAGLAAALMHHALGLTGDAEVVLDAQSYLVGFYTGLGFAPDGPEFLDDGIPHVPMRRRTGTVTR